MLLRGTAGDGGRGGDQKGRKDGTGTRSGELGCSEWEWTRGRALQW
eukprot:gene633-10089_t